MKYVIGVDIGTQSTKCLLVGIDGKVHAQASVAYQPETPKPLWAQQDCAVWFDAVCESVRTCVAGSGVAPSDIAAMCVSSLYGGAGIPVDEQMQPLHPCLIWMDRRATAEVAWVNANVEVPRLEAITGNGVDSYYGFTKILWVREHLPDVWAKTRHFLPPNSYINWRLTGELAVDHSSAGNIGGVYDAARRQWSEEAMQMLGIPSRMMPPRLVESSEVVGGLSAEWAAKLGLVEGMPLMAGGVDAAVATFCAGVTGSGDHVAMIGTSMCWGFVSPTVDARHKLITMPHVYSGADRSYVFGGAITAGAAITWFREAFCQAEVAEAARTGEDAHALIERKAIDVPPGAEGLVFLPYLMGERSPIWDAQANGAFIGLSLAHSRAHLVPRGARRRELRTAAQHRGGTPERAAAGRPADRGRWRGALGPVDADRGGHHGLPGVHHRTRGRGRARCGNARGIGRGAGRCGDGRARLGHAGGAGAARTRGTGCVSRALRNLQIALSSVA